MQSFTSASFSSTQEIEDFRKQLLSRKAEIEAQHNAQLPVSEKLNVLLKEKWEPSEKRGREAFAYKKETLKKVVRMEIAILESVKDFVDPKIAQQIERVFVKVRQSNNLLQMNSVSLRHRDDVKLRQVIKLVNAVYRYNRDAISGIKASPISKSIIKHATLCPHCGETAKAILCNMIASQSILLPS